MQICLQYGRYSLYDWSWSALSKQDVEENSLISDRFGSIDYRNILSIKSKMFNILSMLIEIRKISQDDFHRLLKMSIFQSRVVTVQIEISVFTRRTRQQYHLEKRYSSVFSIQFE